MKVKSIKFALFCLGAMSAFSGQAFASDQEDVATPADVDTTVDAADAADASQTAPVDTAVVEQTVTLDEDGNEIVVEPSNTSTKVKTTTSTSEATTTTTSTVAASTDNVTTAIKGKDNISTKSSDAELKVEQRPEIELLSPMQRKDYKFANVNKKPCGGTSLGKVHYETTPGSRNLIGWKVKKASPTGSCVLRVGDDPRDTTLEVLKLTDGTQDKDGRFPCGRNETPFEAHEFKLPKDLICDACFLQVEWRTDTETQYRCVDFESIGTEVPECFGQCLNGGICRNGKCACPSQFEGSNCQFEKDVVVVDDSNEPGVLDAIIDQGAILLVYVFMLLVIMGLLGGAYYFYNKMRLDQAERDRQAEQRKAQFDKDKITLEQSGVPQKQSTFLQ